MSAYTPTAANVIASGQAKRRAQRYAAVAINAGQPVYEDASNVWRLTDADAAAPANRIDGIADVSVAAGQPLSPVYDDPDFTHGLATVAAGDIIVAGSTAGALHPSTDLAAGWFPLIAMVATSATKAVLKITNGQAAVPA